MIRIQIAATITTDETADVFALHADVAAAAEDEVMFTVADEGLLLNVAGPDLPAVLAVIAPADALGQITFFAAEQPAPAAA
ncbi:hypothetical protein [Dietzia sp. Alg238-R159]|uniref:hypothetical protein n=1 Tax=Dietzia sp. Alg238-R159 TaxID=2305986 RepID=UPI0013D102AB|nr:hypothetical protein [Dietzia sp. Alg238-R159]